jgi:hypothetical protein
VKLPRSLMMSMGSWERDKHLILGLEKLTLKLMRMCGFVENGGLGGRSIGFWRLRLTFRLRIWIKS